MPFAEGQSVSPRVTPELLHPNSMDAANAYGVIIDGQPGPTWFNYQVQLCVTPRNTWIACWTQGGYEANPDQRVVVARSLDEGRTWGAEIVIEASAPNYRVPAWIVSYVVPQTGRVYLFYWYNVNGTPLRDAGDIFFKYSDDDGRTWSDRFRVGVPKTAMDDPIGDIHGWNFGQPRLLPTGQVLMTYAKIRRSSLYPKGWRLDAQNQWQPEPGTDPATKPANEQGGSPNDWCTEVFFIELSNILTETDPAKLKFRFLPEGGEGLWVPYPETDRHFGQEGTLVGLSGGRLLCVFRSRLGHPFYSISADRGARWSKPEVLRLRPGGEPFNQPCAPCPMSKLPDGRFVFLFHNVIPEGGGWYPRDPLWIAVACEAPGETENAGLYFSQPKVVIYNDGVPGGPFKDFEIGYPQFYHFGGRNFVAYSNKTCQNRINEVSDALLDDGGLPEGNAV
jgi:hypothetical protein